MSANANAAAPMTRRDLEAKIIALAWQDEEFRKKFLADPKAQFEARLGTKLPAALKMSAYQEDENSLHFVIPAKPTADLGELSDEELEKVAGGTIGAAISLFIGFTAQVASVAVTLTNPGGW